jgi:undecaprenyl diphosphate synthase
MKKTNSLPQHIAIIMDGNRRWARQNKLKIFKGHEKVARENIEDLTRHCISLGIPFLTLWAFSTENWQRDKAEVEAIMDLMRLSFSEGFDEMVKEKVRVKTIGDLSRFPQDIQESVNRFKEINKKDYKITVTFALNYGGRDEIVRAVRQAVAAGLSLEQLGADELEQYLDTKGIPDPDLIIRTGGEQRLSGFMPWQSVYSELYFTKVLMPDFDIKELDKALKDYQGRIRRFGK